MRGIGKNKKRKKRFLAVLLSTAMICQMLPGYFVGAAQGADGLCPHHPVHTSECGYQEGAGCWMVCKECRREAEAKKGTEGKLTEPPKTEAPQDPESEETEGVETEQEGNQGTEPESEEPQGPEIEPEETEGSEPGTEETGDRELGGNQDPEMEPEETEGVETGPEGNQGTEPESEEPQGLETEPEETESSEPGTEETGDRELEGTEGSRPEPEETEGRETERPEPVQKAPQKAPRAAKSVAKVTISGATTEYTNFKDAFAAANGNTATVELLTNAASNIELTGGTITLCGKGTFDGMLTNNGAALTIQTKVFKVNCVSGTATIEAGGSGSVTCGGGTVILDGGSLSILTCNSGTATVNSGTIEEVNCNGGTTNIAGGAIVALYGEGGTVNITSGTFSGGEWEGICCYDGTISIIGGTIPRLECYGGETKISGGTFTNIIEDGGTLTFLVDSIALNQTALALAAGQETTLSATVSPLISAPGLVAWESDNQAVATVDQKGTVAAVADGEANITVRAGDKSASCRVTVGAKKTVAQVTINGKTTDYSDVEAAFQAANGQVATIELLEEAGKSVSLSGGTILLKGKEFIQGTITNTGAALTVENSVYELLCKGGSVNNTKGSIDHLTCTGGTVSISEEGSIGQVLCAAESTGTLEIKGGSVGTLICSGGTTNVSGGTIREITERVGLKFLVDSVILNQTELALTVGESVTLQATVSPTISAPGLITWESNTPAVATVDQDGNVTAAGNGTATITATAGGQSAACAVTVKNAGGEAPALAIDYTKETVDTTAAMEFSMDGSNWIPCAENMKVSELGWTGDADIDVEIRLKGSEDTFPGAVTNLTIPARPKLTVTQGKLEVYSITVFVQGNPVGSGLSYQLTEAGLPPTAGKWQASNTFSNLTAGTGYTVHVSCGATTDSFAATASIPVSTGPLMARVTIGNDTKDYMDIQEAFTAAKGQTATIEVVGSTGDLDEIRAVSGTITVCGSGSISYLNSTGADLILQDSVHIGTLESRKAVTVAGGSVGSLYCWSGTATISGGWISNQLTCYGGTVTVAENANIECILRTDGTVRIEGGRVGQLDGRESGTTDVYGGAIEKILSFAGLKFHVGEMSLSKETLVMGVSGAETLTANITADITAPVWEWSSSDPSVAEIYQTNTGAREAQINAKKVGKTVVTANMQGSNADPVSCTVIVKEEGEAVVLAIDYIAEKVNTTGAMEYSTDGKSWKTCTADMELSEFGWDGSTAVTAQIRMSETDTSFAGVSTALTIPARPQLAVDKDASKTTASLLAVTAGGNPEGSVLEYRLMDAEGTVMVKDWQTSPEFGELKAGAMYTVLARCTATENSFASKEFGRSMTTADARYTISIPAQAVAGGAAEWIAIDQEKPFDLGYEGWVAVAISGGVSDGTVTLTRENDPKQHTVTSDLLVNGASFADLDQNVAEFKTKEDPAVSVSFTELEGELWAGTYSAAVTFSVGYSQ